MAPKRFWDCKDSLFFGIAKNIFQRPDSAIFFLYLYAMPQSAKYADVLLPLHLVRELTYRLPAGESFAVGEWVQVKVGAHAYQGVIAALRDTCDIDPLRIKEILSRESLPKVTTDDLAFWRELADYYMCTPGDVFKAAFPQYLRKQADVKPRKRKQAPAPADYTQLPELSPAQQKAFDEIEAYFTGRKPVLLHGVTGSGKTEIYMHLARRRMEAGRSVLYLVPEIAMSRQLQERLQRVFGDQLLVFHSRQTAAQRKAVVDKLLAAEGPFLVLGTRSAVLLPARNLGLVVIDEEHDASYKQDDPAPRYNGRDAAMLLAARLGAKVLLGTATPSYESAYNVETGKFAKVSLTEKYHRLAEPKIVIADTARAHRLHNMQGPFTQQLLNEIEKTVARGEQVLVFRSRRAYATQVQCEACGKVPLCPNCHIPLTYHKFNNSLVCHYCGAHQPLPEVCPECGKGALVPVGAGTERIEELLQERFPDLRIARFDADTTERRKDEEKMLSDFAAGKIDILVGTQMITKGFDFDKLSLVAVLSADSLLALQDFRADERALQLLRQFRGRAGRRTRPGKMLIQTAQPDHPVFAQLKAEAELPEADDALMAAALQERRAFRFPPFVRLITLTVRDASEGRLWHLCRDIEAALKNAGIAGPCAPVAPLNETVGRQHVRQFWIRLPRTAALARTKRALAAELDALTLRYRGRVDLSIDVDPL